VLWPLLSIATRVAPGPYQARRWELALCPEAFAQIRRVQGVGQPVKQQRDALLTNLSDLVFQQVL
jgi:hypothetical protein